MPGVVRMDDKFRHSAFAAASKAHAHLASARKQLIGQRLPLAGTHCDLQQASLELRAAQRQIDEALQAVAACQVPGPDA